MIRNNKYKTIYNLRPNFQFIKHIRQVTVRRLKFCCDDISQIYGCFILYGKHLKGTFQVVFDYYINMSSVSNHGVNVNRECGENIKNDNFGPICRQEKDVPAGKHVIDITVDAATMVLESKTTTNNSSSHNDYGSLGGGTDECCPEPDVKSEEHAAELPKTQDQEPPPLTSVGSKAVGTMTSNQGLNDLYQRTPLLSNNANNENLSEWTNSNTNGKIVFKSDEQSDDVRKKRININSNGIVRIDIPGSGTESTRFPEEKLKTCIAFLILVLNLLLTTTSLAIVHEWVPDRKIYKPLPDIFLDNVPARDWTLYFSEILIMISTNSMFLVLVFHRHRFIILRRLFLMLALLYFLRSVTMFVTVLPMSSTTYNCSAKANSTSPSLIAHRVIQLFSGFGLSINGKHTYCGDYIYSGHTTILVMSYLMIYEYSPKKFFLLHWASFAMAVVGVIMVLVAHGHYTVDVLIAYYITTRLFWLYHTLCNNKQLKQSTPYNYLSNVWWFRIFQYFEANVGGPVPKQYDTPLQILRKYFFRHPIRDS